MIKEIKPKKRSKIRLMAGRLFFTLYRRFYWMFGKRIYATLKDNEEFFPNRVFLHSTPLIRKLDGLDITLQLNKIRNLEISTKKLDGLILRPGETMSFWRIVGKPTKRKGYMEGLVLENGKLGRGIGGGLCQLTNLLYWMTLHTPLDVVERYRHSYDVFPDSNRTLPFGSGATCVYNYRDLMIENNTNNDFQLHIYLDNKYLNGEWLSDCNVDIKYEVYEKQHWISQEYWGGYLRHNKIYRRIIKADGNVLAEEAVAENHALMMYQPFLNGNIINESEYEVNQNNPKRD